MSQNARPIAVSNWLFAVAALVFLMVVVGGITRLTESGLSITEWRPITGALPPLSAAAWEDAFALYKATPEYQQINRGMSLSEFKFIFFWEWFHRLLGRVIGLAFALPLAWFAVKRQIPSGYGWRLTLLLLLGGLQGVIGWWMVVSGLSLRTDVSHFRLAIHLMTALFILGLLVWTALDLRTGQRARLRRGPAVILVVLTIQILFGAWTAGLNAGLAASDWPLMNGRFFPEVAVTAQTLAYDPFLIHWVHRWWAWVTVAALVVLARMVRHKDRKSSIAVHSAFGIQILLGIATVMTGVNIVLAVLHQAVGALVVASAAWAVHSAGRQ
ncbi:COX15/CtaA family protein [Sphingomonas sp.]|jgi:cytochrome c oxidase assembly protein subunit 15|uniref:COX15/CtaA family protein n=1 Tax=Sphingomonas sp. TaxID=28214 RepID=UPI002DE2492B|nr:COX15/CtaA family protein [Sphingomonas sp.]